MKLDFTALISNSYSDYFKNLLARHGMLTKNKAWEVQLYYSAEVIAEISLMVEPTGRDHAGASFNISLLGLTIVLQYYDIRHWNDDTNNWENYN